MDYEEVKKIIRNRTDKTAEIYKKIYGFELGKDFSPFDLILDSNDLNANEVFRAFCLVMDRVVLGID